MTRFEEAWVRRGALALILALRFTCPAHGHELPGRFELLAANTVLGGLSVLLTRVLDGAPASSLTTSTAWGMAGAALTAYGKSRAFHLSSDPLAGLEAKLLVSLGTSLVEDVGSGRRPWTTLSTDIGPAYLTWQRGGGWAPRWRLLPVATLSLVETVVEGTEGLDVVSSLQTLQPVFIDRRRFSGPTGGLQSSNTLVLARPGGHALAQELVHALQYRQLFVLQLPVWNDTARASWWKADLGELSLAGMEALGGRAPSDRETLQEREADALEELHPDH